MQVRSGNGSYFVPGRLLCWYCADGGADDERLTKSTRRVYETVYLLMLSGW